MNPLARRWLAVLLCAALVAGSLPPAAFADTPPAANAGPNPRQVMDSLQAWGAFKGPDDVLRSYFFDGTNLTPLGRDLYRSLTLAHDPAHEQQALREEIAQFQDGAFKKLREMGPYNETRQSAVDRTSADFRRNFDQINADCGGAMESSFQCGARLQALLTGAAVPDRPQATDTVQVKTPEGLEVYDKKGLLFRANDNQVVLFNRDIRDMQHAMNQSLPSQVTFVPETGRYNAQMLDYSYYTQFNQLKALTEGFRRQRAMAIADMLGLSGSFRDDQWFAGTALIDEMEARANAIKRDGVLVMDTVMRRFGDRKYYLDQAQLALNAYKVRADALRARVNQAGVLTDAEAQSLSIAEANTKRFLLLGVIDTQKYEVRQQLVSLDPGSPDSEKNLMLIERTRLTDQQRVALRFRASEMADRLRQTINGLETARTKLYGADYMGNMDMANAAVASAQRETGLMATNYAMFTSVPALAYAGDRQLRPLDGRNWTRALDFGSLATRAVYNAIPDSWNEGYKAAVGAVRTVPGLGWAAGALPDSLNDNYRSSMERIAARGAQFDRIEVLMSENRMGEARAALIAMDPDAVKATMSASFNGDAPRIDEAMRLTAVLKRAEGDIARVTETNRILDAAGSFVTFAVTMAVMAPVARYGLNKFVGGLEGVIGGEGTLSRRLATPFLEIAKSSEAAITKLYPDEMWVKATVGENIFAQGALNMAASLRTIAVRQFVFTATSGVISGGFTAGTHLWDTFFNNNLATGSSFLGIRPSPSQFHGVLEALWEGAKGGMLWANEPIRTGPLQENWLGVPLMPGLLGYIGLPATVFKNTPLLNFTELLASRGAAGTFIGSFKLFGAAENAASRSFLEKLAERGPVGFGASFALSMVDNVAKYALFSAGVGQLGWYRAYYAPSWLGGHADARDPDDPSSNELRLKWANHEQKAWGESPAWMLLPSFGMHTIREGQEGARMMEGLRQAREADKAMPEGGDVNMLRIANHLNPDEALPMKPQKLPMSQKIFDYTYRGRNEEGEFKVSAETRLMALKEVLPRRLGSVDGTIEGIPRRALLDAIQTPEGEKYNSIIIDEVARGVLKDLMLQSSLKNPKQTLAALTAAPGTRVEGYDVVMPRDQMSLAKLLYSKKGELDGPSRARVDSLMADITNAREPMKAVADQLVSALAATPRVNRGVDAFGDAIHRRIERYIAESETSSPVHYTEVIRELRATAQHEFEAGRLDAAGRKLVNATLDYVQAGHEVFFKFNTVEKADALAKLNIQALATRFKEAGSEGGMALAKNLGDMETRWRAGQKNPAGLADTGPTGEFVKLVNTMRTAVTNAKQRGAITQVEARVFEETINEIGASPWVYRNTKGEAMKGWRPVQFQAVMESMRSFITKSRAGDPPKLFIQLTTGGGKTLFSAVGLMPFLEADSRALGSNKTKLIYLVPQANLKEQVLREFAEMGLEVEVETYEGFKSKIADGKRKGKDVTREYTVLGDEGDTQQPVLSIGGVSGGLSRWNSLFRRDSDINARLIRRVNARLEVRRSLAIGEAENARRAVRELEGHGDAASSSKALADANALLGADGAKTAELRKALERLRNRAGDADFKADARLVEIVKETAARLEAETLRLNGARTREQRAAIERTVADLAGDLEKLLRTRPTESRITDGQSALGRLRRVLEGRDPFDPPPLKGPLAKWRQKLRRSPEDVLKRYEKDLTQGITDDLAHADAQLGLVGETAGLPRLFETVDRELEAARGLRERAQLLTSRVEQARQTLASVPPEVEGKPATGARGSAQRKLAAAERELADFQAANPPELLQRRLDVLDKFSAEDRGARIFDLQTRLADATDGLNELKARKETALKGGSADDPALLQREIEALETRKLAPLRSELRTQAAENDLELKSLGGGSGRPDTEFDVHWKRTNDLYAAQREAARLRTELGRAERTGSKAEIQALRERSTAKAREVETIRGSLYDAKIAHANAVESGAAAGDGSLLGAMRHRRTTLMQREAELRDEVKAGAPGRQAELDRVVAERQTLERRMVKEVRARIKELSGEIIKRTESRAPGWEDEVTAMLEARQTVMEGFAKDENGAWGVFKEMHDLVKEDYVDNALEAVDGGLETWGNRLDRQGEALRSRLRSESDAASKMTQAERARTEFKVRTDAEIDALVKKQREDLMRAAPRRGDEAEVPLDRSYNEILRDGLERDITGDRLWDWRWSSLKRGKFPYDFRLASEIRAMTRNLEAGPPKGALRRRIGLERYFAARFQREIAKDPLMPPHVKDSLNFLLNRSRRNPGDKDSPTYMREEILGMFKGHFESRANIRLDNLTKRINVIHNGEWFDSMDVATRRFWQIHYETDIDLRYTNESMSSMKDLTTNQKARFVLFSGTLSEGYRKHLGENNVPVAGKPAVTPSNHEDRVLMTAADGVGAIHEAAAAMISSRQEVVIELAELARIEDPILREKVRGQIETQLGHPLVNDRTVVKLTTPEPVRERPRGGQPVEMRDAWADSPHAGAWLRAERDRLGDSVRIRQNSRGNKVVIERAALDRIPDPVLRSQVRAEIEAKLGPLTKERTVARLEEPVPPGERAVMRDLWEKFPEAREWLRQQHLRSNGDANRVLLRPGRDMVRLGDLDAATLRQHLDAPGAIDGKAREGLRKVLALEAVSPDEMAALRAHMQAWNSGDLSAARDAVEAQLSSNIPLEARRALEQYIKDKNWGSESQIALDIRAFESPATREWLTNLRRGQGDTGIVVIVVPDNISLRAVRRYVTGELGAAEDEVAVFFSDATKLRAIRPEADVAGQLNIEGIGRDGRAGRVKFVIGNSKVFGRGLDLPFKGRTSIRTVILGSEFTTKSEADQAFGRTVIDRTTKGANREYQSVTSFQALRELPIFYNLVREDPYFSQLRGDPAFVDFVTRTGDKRRPDVDISLYADYFATRRRDGTRLGVIRADEFDRKIQSTLTAQRRRVEQEGLQGSGIDSRSTPPSQGAFPGLRLEER